MPWGDRRVVTITNEGQLRHACNPRETGYQDITWVVSLACWEGSETGAALLFGSAQYSLHTLTGSGSQFPALCWDCPGCGQ